jgi:hypothetical protein
MVGAASCGEEGRTVSLGFDTALTLTISPTMLDGLPAAEQALGIDAFVVLMVDAPANGVEPEAREIAFKRIRVSTSASPNTNPSIDEFLVHGSPAADVHAEGGDVLPLAATASAGSLQNFVDPLGEPQIEELKYSWFATGGRFEHGLTFGDSVTGETTNEWHVPDVVEPADLWLVLRDPRGGVDWRHRRVLPQDVDDPVRSRVRACVERP